MNALGKHILKGNSWTINWQSGYSIKAVGLQFSYDIGDGGQVVGSLNNKPAVWHDGGTTILSETRGQASAISQNGTIIVGKIYTDVDATWNPVLWRKTNGGWQQESLPFRNSSICGTAKNCDAETYNVNNSGQVLGQISNNSAETEALVLWENGSFQEPAGGSLLNNLGIFPFSQTGLTSDQVNNLGQVVGYSTNNPSGSSHAFVWQQVVPEGQPQLQDLGTFGGNRSRARDINDSGQVVGHAEGNSGLTAFLWQGGVFSESNPLVDLNTLIDPKLGIRLAEANGINTQGQILANDHLLTPNNIPADLELSLNIPATTTPEAAVTYAVNLTNKGKGDATDVQVEFLIPNDFTVVQTVGWSGCTTSGSTVTCKTDTLKTGERRAFLVDVKTPAATGFYGMTARVSAKEDDPRLGNNLDVGSTIIK